MLGIEPFRCWKKGDKRKCGSEFLFSSWDAEKSDIDRLDIEEQPFIRFNKEIIGFCYLTDTIINVDIYKCK
jgi:hypothetical protein